MLVVYLPKIKKELGKEIGNKEERNKACFQHDMAHGKTKDLVKRTQSDKVFKDKAFKIASDPKYDGYHKRLSSMVYKFFDKKSSRSGIAEPSYQLEDGDPNY